MLLPPWTWQDFLFYRLLKFAKAAAAPRVNDHAMLWEIKRQAIEFKNIISSMSARIFHISREINGVTHQCTHQAKLHTRSRPTRSCRNSAHRNSVCLVAIDCNHCCTIPLSRMKFVGCFASFTVKKKKRKCFAAYYVILWESKLVIWRVNSSKIGRKSFTFNIR
jgi:hypothetical protein